MTSAANAGVMPDTRGLLLQPGYPPYVPTSFVPNYGTPTQAFAYGENNAASFTQHHDVRTTGWGPATIDKLLDSSFLSGSGGEEPFYNPYSQPFAHTVPSSDQLPPLPAPPSASEFSSPPQILTSVNPRKRRPEVDDANIIHCSRARTKSAKLKLASEPEASSSSKPKRAKATKKMCLTSANVPHINTTVPHINATVPHINATVPHIDATMPHIKSASARRLRPHSSSASRQRTPQARYIVHLWTLCWVSDGHWALEGLALHDRGPPAFTAPPHVQHLLPTDPITLLTTDALSAAVHRAFFANSLATALDSPTGFTVSGHHIRETLPLTAESGRSSPHRGTGGGLRAQLVCRAVRRAQDWMWWDQLARTLVVSSFRRCKFSSYVVARSGRLARRHHRRRGSAGYGGVAARGGGRSSGRIPFHDMRMSCALAGLRWEGNYAVVLVIHIHVMGTARTQMRRRPTKADACTLFHAAEARTPAISMLDFKRRMFSALAGRRGEGNYTGRSRRAENSVLEVGRCQSQGFGALDEGILTN
ncbi:hypothetical protein DFH09DRAFT_1270285 [Mycena vulgaris]|nr:hypothetical protein DFH09DRAFT_1270285 [Mycena vulgaris]